MDYHASTAISRSMLNVFRHDVTEYYGAFVAEPPLFQPVKETFDMALGSLAHCYLLEPTEVVNRYITIPESVLAADGSRRGNTWALWNANALERGLTPVTADQQRRAMLSAASMKLAIAPWLDAAREVHLEEPIVWESQGLQFRAMPDAVLIGSDTVICVDAKLSKEAPAVSAFRTKARRFGYDLQDVHYSEGVYHQYGTHPSHFFFLNCKSSPVYQCRLFEFGPKTKESAGREYVWLVDDLARRYAENAWDDPASGQIEMVEL